MKTHMDRECMCVRFLAGLYDNNNNNALEQNKFIRLWRLIDDRA